MIKNLHTMNADYYGKLKLVTVSLKRHVLTSLYCSINISLAVYLPVPRSSRDMPIFTCCLVNNVLTWCTRPGHFCVELGLNIIVVPKIIAYYGSTYFA